MSTTCGAPPSASPSTYAPRATPAASAYFVRSMKPSFWRVRTRATGPVVCVSATRHASAVSVASAGRTTVMFGIERSDVSCSIGWCVGPSSPRPIESCVKT